MLSALSVQLSPAERGRRTCRSGFLQHLRPQPKGTQPTVSFPLESLSSLSFRHPRPPRQADPPSAQRMPLLSRPRLKPWDPNDLETPSNNVTSLKLLNYSCLRSSI